MLSAGLSLLVTVLVVSVTAYYVARRDLKEHISTHLQSVAESRAAHVGTFVRQHRERILFAATSRVLRVGLRNLRMAGADRAAVVDDLNKRLEGFRDPDSDVYEVFLLDGHGEVVASTTPERIGMDGSTNAYFIGARGGPFLKGPYPSKTTGRNSLALSAPLADRDTGELLGVLVARLDSSGLDKIMTDHTGLGRTGETYLVNEDGFMITPSRFREDTFLKQKIDTENAREWLAHVAAMRAGRLPETHGHEAEVFTNYRGVRVLGVHGHVSATGWGLMAEMDAREAFAPIARLRSAVLLCGALVAAAGLAVAGVLARRISRPIHALHVGSERIGGGDLRCRVRIHTGDEIEQLANEFNRMAARLADSRASLERKVADRTRELEQSYRTLRESEHKYRDLFENLNDAAFLADIETGIILETNLAAETLLGRSRDEIIGMHQAQLHPPGQAEVYRKKFADHIEQGRAADYEGEAIRKDGTVVPVSISAAVLSVQGRPVILGLFRDITEFRRAVDKLREAHAQTEAMVAAISSILIGLDEGWRVARWNASAEETFGRSAAAVCGELLEASGIVWDWARVAGGIAACTGTGRPVRLDDVTFTRRDGQPGFLGLTISPMGGGDGVGGGCLIVARDITERRTLEGQLAQAQKLEAIGQLAAGIAHEINTPTQYVGDNTRFLKESFGDLGRLLEAYQTALAAAKDGPIPPALIEQAETVAQDVDIDYLRKEIPRAIEQSIEGTDRVAKIVRAMKEFSHPGEHEKMPTDLNKAIESTVTVSRNEWKYVADLVTDLDPALPEVPCLPGDVNQVILNLIINAAHAIADATDGSGEKGTITVGTRHDGDWVEIRVSDTGGGIPEAIRSRVFEPFFTTKDVGQGTGQGLAIAHTVVVEKHGGTIDFETETGKGTTFRLRLPVHAGDLQEVEA